MVGVTTTSYPGFGVIIYIVSKEDNSYHVIITNIPHCTCPNLTKISSQALGRDGNKCIANIYIMCLDF